MSTDTPERPNIYKERFAAIARAVRTWQEGPDEGADEPLADASALDDCLQEQGLLILPRAVDSDGRYLVLVDGQPACFPGQDRVAGPVDAEQAAEMFLFEAAKDGDPEIVVRPASEREMVVSAVTGAAAVYEEPVRITAETYSMSREKATGRVEVEIGGSGRRVLIDLGDDGDEILAGLLGFHERDPEDTFFDEDDDTPGGAR